MSEHEDRARHFLARHFLDLHVPGKPLLIPNPWDCGSARLLASLGYRALATTSSGFAGTLGRNDGSVTRNEALEHARLLAGATGLPVSADLEQGFADEPKEVAETMRLAAATGLAGCSVEDWSGDALYDASLAAERIAAAAEVTRASETRLVLTARSENFLRGHRDLADTIARLQSFQAAGADVLYAPGLSDVADIEQVVRSVDAPVNVLLLPNGPEVAELAAAGVARVSVGGAFYHASLAALAKAGRELLEQGTKGFWVEALQGMGAHKQAVEKGGGPA